MPALLKDALFGDNLEAKHADLPEGGCGSLHTLLCSGKKKKKKNSDGGATQKHSIYALGGLTKVSWKLEVCFCAARHSQLNKLKDS